MKSLFLITALITFAKAQAYDQAIGFSLGSQTGLSGKYDLKRGSHTESVQSEIANKYLTVDYMRKDKNSFQRKFLKWYYGPGVVLKNNIGVRAATSLEYHFEEYPIHLLSKLSVALIDGTELGVVVGARYEF